MVLGAALLNTQHYKVRIKGKVEQSRERSRAPLHLGVVAIENGAFESPSTPVSNLLSVAQQKGIDVRLTISNQRLQLHS